MATRKKAAPKAAAKVSFRQVPNQTGLRAGSDGSIVSTRSNNLRELTPTVSRNGYARISIKAKEKALVHRLVAQAYIANPHNYPQVNHIDGDKRNNIPSNLEWCSAKHNSKHSRETGLQGDKSLPVLGYTDGGGGVWFRSAVEASRHGFTRSLISMCIAGKQKTHRGYTWLLGKL